MVESIKDYAIYMLTPEGIIDSWNPGAEHFKGYSAAEVIGRSFSIFYTEEDRTCGLPEKALHTARNDGKFENEGRRVRKDGTCFWAHVVIDPVSAMAPLSACISQGLSKMKRRCPPILAALLLEARKPYWLWKMTRQCKKRSWTR
jgi:PAS domain S-box-containing protein